MFRQQFYIIANFLMAFDALVVVASGYVAYVVSLEHDAQGLVMGWYDFLGCVLFLMFANNFFLGRFRFYSPRRFHSSWAMVGSLTAAVSSAFVGLAAGAIVFQVSPFSRTYLVVHFLGTLVPLAVARLVLYRWLDRRGTTAFNARQLLLVGSEKRLKAVAEALEEQPSWGHQIMGCVAVDEEACGVADVPALGRLEDLGRILGEHQIDEVVFALPKRSAGLDLKPYLETCKRRGIAVRIVPSLFDLSDPRLRVDTIQGIPTLTDYPGVASASGLLHKKIMDLVGGLIGFIVFLSHYPFVALAIKLDSPGPVLFKQRRIGMNGRHFTLYKFRTMGVDAEARKQSLLDKSEMNGPMFKIENDPRVTRVGRFLRKSSIDELPQFINVLKGEMSLVGTRPPTVDEVAQYEDWQLRRISSKPGITGLWQVSGRNKITDFQEVVKLDVQYFENWRFRRDVVILWKTIWVVLGRKGAK